MVAAGSDPKNSICNLCLLPRQQGYKVQTMTNQVSERDAINRSVRLVVFFCSFHVEIKMEVVGAKSS